MTPPGGDGTPPGGGGTPPGGDGTPPGGGGTPPGDGGTTIPPGTGAGGTPFVRFSEPGSFSANAGYRFSRDPDISDATKADVAAIGLALMTGGTVAFSSPLVAATFELALLQQTIIDGFPPPRTYARISGDLVRKAEQIRLAGTHSASRNRRTIAVGEDQHGNLYAASSNRFDRGQRAAAKALNIQCVNCRGKAHAEEHLIREVPGLRRVGTSNQPPCGPSGNNCRGQLLERGVVIDND